MQYKQTWKATSHWKYHRKHLGNGCTFSAVWDSFPLYTGLCISHKKYFTKLAHEVVTQNKSQQFILQMYATILLSSTYIQFSPFTSPTPLQFPLVHTCIQGEDSIFSCLGESIPCQLNFMKHKRINYEQKEIIITAGHFVKILFLTSISAFIRDNFTKIFNLYSVQWKGFWLTTTE